MLILLCFCVLCDDEKNRIHGGGIDSLYRERGVYTFCT